LKRAHVVGVAIVGVAIVTVAALVGAVVISAALFRPSYQPVSFRYNGVTGYITRNYFFRAVQAGSQTITLQDQRQFAPYDIASTINIKVAVS
jgi:hypothetical protein